jgi:hypothetical protein
MFNFLEMSTITSLDIMFFESFHVTLVENPAWNQQGLIKYSIVNLFSLRIIQCEILKKMLEQTGL